MQDKKHQLELDMEEQTDLSFRKEHVKALYCDLAYLTYMQSISCDMLGWMKLNLAPHTLCLSKYHQQPTQLLKSKAECFLILPFPSYSPFGCAPKISFTFL